MKKIFIFGGGAVGMALAVHLSKAGRNVILVRTSGVTVEEPRIQLAVNERGIIHRALVDCVDIAKLDKPEGLLVITTKAHANSEIASSLLRTRAQGPIVLLQNGIGVESAFLKSGFERLYRAVLYVTGQRETDRSALFHAIKPSVVGMIRGSHEELKTCVDLLNSEIFPFEVASCIEKSVWQKTLVNCAFNSICPLLESDNGVFARDPLCQELALLVIRECLGVASRMGVELEEDHILEQIDQISRGSKYLISTLQDIRKGQPTEIEFLNLEVSRLAASLDPPLKVPRTEMLGKLILAKSRAQHFSIW